MDKSSIKYKSVPFEAKQIESDDDDIFRFEGFASTFGNEDLGGDIVVKGAFAESLKRITPKILWQHDRYEPIGMPEKVVETDIGLEVIGALPKDDSLVSGRVIPQFKIGSVSALSIGYFIEDFSVIDDVFFIEKAELIEFSPVTFPMNPSAVITGFKSMLDSLTDITEEDKKKFASLYRKYQHSLVDSTYNSEEVKNMTKRRLESVLRDSGFSKDAALIVAKDFSGQSESAGEDASEMEAKLDTLLETAGEFKTHQLARQIDNISNRISS